MRWSSRCTPPGTGLHPAFTIPDGDVVVTKRRTSAFTGTDLDMVLRARGVRPLAVTGAATSAMVAVTRGGAETVTSMPDLLRDIARPAMRLAGATSPDRARRRPAIAEAAVGDDADAARDAMEGRTAAEVPRSPHSHWRRRTGRTSVKVLGTGKGRASLLGARPGDDQVENSMPTQLRCRWWPWW
ncbi:cysteine hydrolase family protein [Nonomuraea sp. SYSU D8015]|uniref:cysteine hydrolase family protein n=1 Tax=Nonomuraea sp. SYSU D8015 TaxID=2593644 RepID=UPI001CB6BC64|nr:isochorismatase family protein [Nonomuraea sp. SYSU D8015]